MKSSKTLGIALFSGAATAAILSTSAFAASPPIETVIVTGSLIAGGNLVSPVTTLQPIDMQRSGTSTVQDALQNSILNNGPAVTNGWTANGNFAQGASGASLRGLTTNSTLVLFDGMRAAYYPLADDGVRNFVDLNTIPDDIVERVEILRDGASSTYGADAIAGVINIITKKEFEGLAARAEGGISSRGDAAEERLSVTAGTGELASGHLNIYASAFYYHADQLNASTRPYPFNTYDWSHVCFMGFCDPNNVRNGIQPSGAFALSTAANFLVRPYNFNPVTNQITTPIAGSRWQNETPYCGNGTLQALTVAQQGAANPPTVCQYDARKLYGVINPGISRGGLSGHASFELPDGINGWVEANFMQDSVGYPGQDPTFVGNAPTGIFFPRFSTSTNFSGASPPAPGSISLFLPVWVCPERVNCATAADRVLNPQNPFAALNEPARIIGRDITRRTFNDTRNRSYRVAGGMDGSLFDDWKWNLGVTAMHTDLREKYDGYVYIQHLLDTINDGSFNFLNPLANTKAVSDYVYPEDINNLSSDEAQLQATMQHSFFKLPGGDLTLLFGTSLAYEAIDGPSANTDFAGPTQRRFTLNAFGTKGSRDVYAGFFEISAPVIDELTINVSGRYDSYSSGQSGFTPKVGFNARPFDGLTLKGTYSEGFRIPSFAESNALPTTGYVTNTKPLFNNTYLAQYGCSLATYNTCPSYITQGSYGLTNTSNPNLKPEKSRSWVMDVNYQPFDELVLGVTYYNIKKKGAIDQLSCGAALIAYYAGTALPPGCTITPDAPDPNFAAAQPRVAFLEAPFVNSNSVRTSGFDFSVTVDSDLAPVEDYMDVSDFLGPVHVTSTATASWIRDLETEFPDGSVERYDGTLGNFNLTAGTGTFKWRGLWQTTFSEGDAEFTSSLNWTSGYNLSAMDQGTGYRDCGLADGATPCRINDYFTWDVNALLHVREDTAVYFTIKNVLDNMPPVDTVATYAITGYNAVVAGDGIVGRDFKLGVKFDY